MAKYEITHSCGHSSVVQLVGPSSERTRKQAWLESQECAQCKETERIKVAQGLIAMQAEQGLPALIGSEKSIAWAAKIRHDYLRVWQKLESMMMERFCKGEADSPLAEQALFELDDHKTLTIHNEYAQFWIDNRYTLEESGMKRLMAEKIQPFADHLKNVVVQKDFPLSADEQKEVIKVALDAKRDELQVKREAEAKRRIAEVQEAQKKREQEVAEIWAKRDETASKIFASLEASYFPAELNVWFKDNTEKRVYLNAANKSICLYVTGNKRKRPGSLEGSSSEELKAALLFASETYARSTSFTISNEGKVQ